MDINELFRERFSCILCGRDGFKTFEEVVEHISKEHKPAFPKNYVFREWVHQKNVEACIRDYFKAEFVFCKLFDNRVRVKFVVGKYEVLGYTLDYDDKNRREFEQSVERLNEFFKKVGEFFDCDVDFNFRENEEGVWQVVVDGELSRKRLYNFLKEQGYLDG